MQKETTMREGKSPLSLEEIALHFDLTPHPEGGFYKETWRSSGTIPQQALPVDYAGPRCYCTLILYLLGPGQKSKLHRLRQDETWHFYQGGPLELTHISPQGELTAIRLGQDIPGGELPHYVVPAGHWFGATPAQHSAYCLAGCTVAPGFEFADFELADAAALLGLYPALAEPIRALA